MNSEAIQESVYTWVQNQGGFNAPYGILISDEVSKAGKKYKSVTFGRAWTLDVTVEIYNRNFMLVRTSRFGTQTFQSYTDLMTFLETL